jgi:hypothetical protein
MEIKATLNKPFTKEQKTDFIVCNNHQKGYDIKETDIALEAWGYTEEEEEQRKKDARKRELLRYLDDLDLKSIRPLRAKEAGTDTQEDLDKLEEIEMQVLQIRAELKELANE